MIPRLKDWPNTRPPTHEARHWKQQWSYQKQYVRNGDNLVTSQVTRLLLVEMPRVLQIKGDGIIVFVIYNINLLFGFPVTENSSEV